MNGTHHSTQHDDAMPCRPLLSLTAAKKLLRPAYPGSITPQLPARCGGLLQDVCLAICHIPPAEHSAIIFMHILPLKVVSHNESICLAVRGLHAAFLQLALFLRCFVRNRVQQIWRCSTW